MPARKIRCPECDYRFTLDAEDLADGRVRCPDCRAVVPLRGGYRRHGGSGTKWIVFFLVLVCVLFIGCCAGLVGLVWWSIKPTSFPEQTQDYADARKTFKTKLVRKDEAPQDWVDVQPPAGVTEVTYTSDGQKLKAWVNPPAAGDAPKPAVLFLHGGFAFGSEDWDQCKPFRDAGFVTMTPLLRAENGQKGDFTLFYDEVDDVVAAAEALAATPGVDPNRVYVAGHSAGGTLAMLAAMTSKRFKGCASFSGSPDQVAFVRGQQDLAPFDPKDRQELIMRSPLAFPKSFKCPARLYWGADEFEFSMATKALAEKSKAAGLDVQAIEVPGDHMTAVDPAMTQAISFFKQPAPPKKGPAGSP
jgi:dienelactone hydrolase